MTWYGRLSRGETRVDFVGKRRRWMTISAILLAVSLLSLGVRQLNLGIEFIGGVAIQTENRTGATVSEVRRALTQVGVDQAIIQLLEDGAAVRVQTGVLSESELEAAGNAVVSVTGSTRDETSIESVGPTFGDVVARRALTALLVFLGAVVVFISWRLELKMAMTGLAALLHDLILTVGVYSLTGFEVTPATVVAVLTILGYSLYDTVVVFDKVRELAAAHDDLTYSEIVNRSMNQVLARSLNTSLTSLLPVGSILFVGSYLLGAPTLLDFALALFVGIGVGTYSSIFVAAPLLATWKEREEEWEERRTRLERRARPDRT